MGAIGSFAGCCITSADIVMDATNRRPNRTSSTTMMTLIRIKVVLVSGQHQCVVSPGHTDTDQVHPRVEAVNFTIQPETSFGRLNGPDE